MSAEPVSISEKKVEQEPPKQETKLQLPGELAPLVGLYQKVVESPNDLNVLWDFVQNYLTFLESKTNLILPLIKEIHPDSKATNLILALKENSINNIPWSVYNCFLTLSNIGSSIAQKEPKDDKDKFYLLYVMLSINNDSPTYSFTELLQTLQTQNNDTQEIYNKLNEKFLKASEQYNTPTKDESKEGFMSKSFKVPYCDYQVQAKWLIIIFIVIIFLVVIGVGGYFYSGNNVPTVSSGGLSESPTRTVSICSDVDSIAGFGSD